MRLESDNSIIFRTGSVSGRLIVIKMALRIPRMLFNADIQRTFLNDYMKPKTWSYLKERIEISPTYQVNQRQETFRIPNSIRKSRHIFVWILNTANTEIKSPWKRCRH